MIVSSKEKLVTMWKFNDLEIDGQFESVNEFLKEDKNETVEDNKNSKDKPEEKDDTEEIILNPITQQMIKKNNSNPPQNLHTDTSVKETVTNSTNTEKDQSEALFSFSIKPIKITTKPLSSLNTNNSLNTTSNENPKTSAFEFSKQVKIKDNLNNQEEQGGNKDNQIKNESDNEENLIEFSKDQEKSKKVKNINDIFFS